MNHVTVHFQPEKETKGTWRFKEITGPGEQPRIRTLYLRKDTLQQLGYAAGQNVTVTVTLGETA